MKPQSLLWVGLALLAWSAWRSYLRNQALAKVASGPLTVNSDTNIIDEDDTGEALERLIKQLDENVLNGENRYVNFAVETPELNLSYNARPYVRTVPNTQGKKVPYIP
jgi:hypothetical protein